MPQLWLTYQELADEMGCGSGEARATAIGSRWTRKRSRDGLTRVLMPAELMFVYLARSTALATSTDAMVATLRSTLATNARPERLADFSAKWRRLG